MLRRQDLAFVVSRALSVWLVTAATQVATQIAYALSMYVGVNDFMGRTRNNLLITYFVQIAAYIFLAVWLWIKAPSFGRLSSSQQFPEDIDKEDLTPSPERSANTWPLQRVLIDAIAFYVCLANIGPAIVGYITWKDEAFLSGVHPGYNNAEGFVTHSIPIACGVLVLIVTNYGAQIKNFFHIKE